MICRTVKHFQVKNIIVMKTGETTEEFPHNLGDLAHVVNLRFVTAHKADERCEGMVLAHPAMLNFPFAFLHDVCMCRHLKMNGTGELAPAVINAFLRFMGEGEQANSGLSEGCDGRTVLSPSLHPIVDCSAPNPYCTV